MALPGTRTRAAANEEAMLRALGALTALVFLTCAVLVSGSDPLLTIPALALLDCGIRTACRAAIGE